MTFSTKQRVAIRSWIATAAPHEDTFFRSVERRWMDPDDVLSGAGTVASGGRLAAPGTKAVFLSTTDTGASKETTARKARLGGAAQITTAKYPRVVFAVEVKLSRLLKLDDLASFESGAELKDACLDADRLDVSMSLSTELQKAGIQGVIFPSVVAGGDENLVVYVSNCAADTLELQNKDDFIEQARKIVAKHKP